jgi:hypothetical protein
MAEQIITLGIGGTPDSLTPFITTGLEIGVSMVVPRLDVAVSVVEINVVTLSEILINVVTLSEILINAVSLSETLANDE